MRQRPAIEIALDLKAMPSLAKVIRKRPLPPEVTPVLRVAAGSHELAQELSTKYGCSAIHIREACIFFLQQSVLFPSADSYRTLGVNPGASPEQIREHRRWLLMWLHPDRNKDKWESALFERVVSAASSIGGDRAAAVKPVRKAVGRHEKASKRWLQPKKTRPRQPPWPEISVKPLVVLLLAASAFLLSVATIVSALGAEARPHVRDSATPVMIKWVR